ncbi:hypothetical protein SNE40_003515 [Patella caerulea]|uniref:Cytochrome P450 n=1 Tax=Patella caerulea TaxID=87958 RepID=A0AAN8Q0X4_PATCE
MKAVRNFVAGGQKILSRHGHSDSLSLHDLKIVPELPNLSKQMAHMASNPTSSIPGPASLPLIGALWQYLPGGRFYGLDFNESVRRLQSLYGDIVREEIVPGFTVIRLYNPEHFVDVYKAEGDLPTRALFGMLKRYNQLYNQDVQGLLTSQGQAWQQMRREIQQEISSPRAARAYVKNQMSVADEFLERLTGLRDEDGTVTDFLPEIYKYVTEAIGIVCFDGRLGVMDPDNTEGQQFIEAVSTSLTLTQKELSSIPLYKIINTSMFNKYCRAMNTIKNLSEKYMDAAFKRPFEDDDSLNLVQHLTYKSKLSYREVFTFLSEIFFGGIDSTGHCLAFSLHALSRHPEVQEKVYDEIKSLSPRDINNGALDHTSYLRAFLKETLRMYPVAPGLGRTTSKATTIAGYHIPAQTNIVLHYDMAGKNGQYIAEPDSFKPERWLRPNKTNTFPYITVPFGFGPRSCPARRLASQEVSLILIKILQRFEIAESKTDLPIKMQFLNAPAEPLSYTFKERQT